MKKDIANEKGFLLAEAIVVGVFVLSLFTFLFVNIIPLIGRYEAQEKYDNITSVYNTNLIREMIMADQYVNSVIRLNSQSYKSYTPQVLCNALEKTNYCKTLLGKSYLDVKKIYITWYRTAKIKNSVKSTDFDRASRDYITSLEAFNKPTGTTYDKYHRLIVYYNDGSFANAEIKLSE